MFELIKVMKCINNADYSLKCVVCTYYIGYSQKILIIRKYFSSIKNNYSIKQKSLVIQGVQMGDISTYIFIASSSYLLKESSPNS